MGKKTSLVSSKEGPKEWNYMATQNHEGKRGLRLILLDSSRTQITTL